jgi:PAS domain S-box-containing protein
MPGLTKPSSSRRSKPKSAAIPSRPTKSLSRIIGHGEMAELIRNFAWDKTPVGPVETWSDTLLTTVNLLLASRHPMFLWWGPDLIQFYNDGYRPSIRADKHPSAVGQRGADCWPEIWTIIGPQIEAVMTQGASTWNINQLVPINRNGQLEEVFWTYSYSAVRDKSGKVCGTLVVCSETTEQVLSERRLRTLLGLAVDPQAQNQPAKSQSVLTLAQELVKKLRSDPPDLPFASLYFLTEDQVKLAASTASAGVPVSSGNWPLLQVSRSKTPRLVEDLQERFGDLIIAPWPEPVKRAYVSPLPLPGSSVQAVLVFGISPRLPFDAGYRTFFELLVNRIASLLQNEAQQMEIAQAAKRFRRLTEANPFGLVIGDLDGQLSYVNSAFLQTLGYTEADVSAGKLRWDQLTPPEYAKADARAVEQLRALGRCDVYEKVYFAKDGRRVPILVGASAIDPAAPEREIAAFVTDLTPLKRAEEALRKANEELELKVTDRTAALESEIADRRRAEISLRELTGRLLLTQDEERRHMARELHDHAGQTLVALALKLFELGEAAKGHDPKIVRLASEGEQLSDALSREIRTLSYLLHPPLLDEAGISSALRWYVEGFSERSKIAVDLDLPSDLGRLPRELELVVFRVVQESLTNIHRHSGSASARIHLTRTSSAIRFEISDQGKGLSPEYLREGSAARVGVGVRGMEERVRQFRGTLQIIPNHPGTKVSVMIPLTPDQL